MDKKEMDEAIKEAMELVDLLPSELIEEQANEQYDQIMKGVGMLIVATVTHAYVGDSERLKQAKDGLKDAVSRLDVIVERFGIESRHEHVKKHLVPKEASKGAE